MRPSRRVCEMDAQLYGYLAEGLQSRRMPSRATPIMAVPAGLSPSEHFEAGLAAASPLEQDRVFSAIIELNHIDKNNSPESINLRTEI